MSKFDDILEASNAETSTEQAEPHELKPFIKDGIWFDFLTAKTQGEQQQALQDIKSIRGQSSIDSFKSVVNDLGIEFSIDALKEFISNHPELNREWQRMMQQHSEGSEVETENDEYQPGHFVKMGLPEQGTVFMKIKDKTGNHVDLEPTEDDIVDSAEPMTVPVDDCGEYLTPHQFGQTKRFSDGGTGFSKDGRKLKYPRSQHLESFLDKEKDVDDLLSNEVQEATGSAQELRDMLKQEFPNSSEFDREAAIYWYANHFHTGQRSPLYQVLSQSNYEPGRAVDGIEDEGEVVEMMYDYLQNELETP